MQGKEEESESDRASGRKDDRRGTLSHSYFCIWKW